MLGSLKDDLATRLRAPKGLASFDEARARRASDVIFAAIALIYPAWYFVFVFVMPAARDSLAERLVVSAVSIGALALSRRKLLRSPRIAAEQAVLFLMTGHYLSLLWRNNLAPEYVVGLYVLFASCSVVIASLGIALLYSITSLVAVGIMMALLDHHLQLQAEWFLGMTTMMVALCVGAHRSSAVRRSATNRLLRERRLLQQIIEAIPDPVFVRGGERDLILINQAGRAFEDATGFNLDPIIEQELTTLETTQPIAADAEVTTTFGAIAVSVKTATLESSDLETLVITIMRDVTDRRNLERSLRSKVDELMQAQERVRQLQGMLPICMHCSRIRTDSNQWEPLETYVTHHSDASFTHTLCSSCLERHYPD